MVQFYVALPATIDDIDADSLSLDEQTEPTMIFHAQDGVWVDLDATRRYYEERLSSDYQLHRELVIPWEQLNLAEQATFASDHAVAVAGLLEDDWRPDPEDINDFLQDAWPEAPDTDDCD